MDVKVTREEQQKWASLTDFFQYGSLGMLILTIIVLESMPKEYARMFVWYFAGFIFVFATIGFFVGRVSGKMTRLYFEQEHQRIIKKYDIKPSQTSKKVRDGKKR